MSFVYKVILIVIVVVMSACSTATIVRTQKGLPEVYEENNATHDIQKVLKVTLFQFNNYTDTPKAGMRASNIIEGILLTKGYIIKSYISEKTPALKKARKIAKKDGSKYFMYGGVSEWRYKTGIDGEPAVSIQSTLYETKNGNKIWSAVGSDSDWGNASIGTTAQNLLDEMMFY